MGILCNWTRKGSGRWRWWGSQKFGSATGIEQKQKCHSSKCQEVMPGVCVHLMTQEDLQDTQGIALWEQALEVKGISKTHHAEMKKGTLSIFARAMPD